MHHFAYRRRPPRRGRQPSRYREEVGTPFYCYSTATLERHYRVFADAFQGSDALVCYAIKSNSNLAVLRTLGAARRGHGRGFRRRAARARAAGSGERIVFSGVGKTRERWLMR